MTPITLASIAAAVSAVAGAIFAIFKIAPDRQSIIVTAAQGAVVVQSGVIDDLQEQIKEMRARLHEQNGHAEQLRLLRRQVESITDRLQAVVIQRDRLKMENERLTARVAHLELIVREAGLDDPDVTTHKKRGTS